MLGPDDHYVVISCDTHAGGSHAQYREYLDDQYKPAFDVWREKYKNPFKDLKNTDDRVRNWDAERRDGDQNRDGVVAEVIFPNTVPPFFPNFVLFAQPPTADEYELRHAGIRAHNRWMADYCAQKPEARAGIGQIFLNDVDDTLEDIHWIHENGLRGGVLIGSVPPTCDWLAPLYDPIYDPVWALCEKLDIPVNAHVGTGGPVYKPAPAMPLVHFEEIPFYGQRPLTYMILGGVFERFPNLKFTLTEAGCAWIPDQLEKLDLLMDSVRSNTAGEMRIPGELVPPKSATEYFQQNCYVGVSQPSPRDMDAAVLLGCDKVMWGSDYPHDEGTFPYTHEHLRQVMGNLRPEQIQQILSGTAAEIFKFDLAALQPAADIYGPTVASVATPLTELPENPNQALKKAAYQLAKAN